MGEVWLTGFLKGAEAGSDGKARKEQLVGLWHPWSNRGGLRSPLPRKVLTSTLCDPDLYRCHLSPMDRTEEVEGVFTHHHT